MMKTLPDTRSFRTVILAITAITAMTLSSIVSASVSNIVVSYDKTDLKNHRGQVIVYQKLQNASRQLCGSSNVRVTGSLMRATANQECYEGTLTAAVQRLDHPAITALHTN